MGKVKAVADVSSEYTIHLPFEKPHPAQEKILACKSRMIILCCGRRFGKNACGSWWVPMKLYGSESEGRPMRVWFLAPTFNVVHEMEMQYLPMFRDVILNKTKGLYRSDNTYNLLGGHILEFRSAEMTGNIGAGVDILVIDEAAKIPDKVYSERVLPTLLGRCGKVFIISTPDPDNPKNWFYREVLRGLGKMDKDISAFQFSTYDNPHIPVSELELLRESMSYSAFQTQIMAQFPDDDYGVFRNIKKCVMDGGIDDGYKNDIAVDVYKCSKCTHRYKGHFICPVCRTENELSYDSESVCVKHFIGFDPAKSVDFSVIKVLEYVSGRPYLREVHSERFNDVSYEAIKNRLYNVYERYPYAIGLMDCSGAGDPLLEDIQTRVNMTGYHFNGTTKTVLIENLVRLFDGEKIRILPDINTENELATFTTSESVSGQKRYHSPPHQHDDCVIALALAAWASPRMFNDDFNFKF